MGVVSAALRNPHAVIVAGLAILVMGIVSLQQMPADLLPIFKTPAVQIVTFYPGMPSEVMERDIMSRLERWTGQSVGIEHQEAKAMLGVSVVKNFFREGISLETAMSQVTSYAVSDMFYLPPGTIPPMIMPFDPTASIPLCLVSVSGNASMTEKDLYDVAYFELRNRLQSIRGVIAPAVYGGTLRRILAYVDRTKLVARGLSPMDVVRALREQNVFVPTGNAKIGDLDYMILSNAMVPEVEDLNKTPIKLDGGAPVFLEDVGRVQDSHQIQTNIVRVNGRRQVYIPIYRQPGENTIRIVDAVRGQSEQILQRLKDMDPRAQQGDLRLDVVFDQSVAVRKTIRVLSNSALLGAGLAALVVFVFLASIRSTLIILTVLPLAVLAAFMGMFFMGNTLNSMTLGGLALAVGILVDQAIVVLDNISRHLRLGKTSMQAALDGTSEVALPVLVSTVTFIIVFLPVVFLSGMAKFLFTPLAVAVTFAMIASYVFAITLVPTLCSRLLRAERPAGTEAKFGTRWFISLGNGYQALLERLLRRRGILLGALGIISVVTLIVFGRLGTELFPQVDAGQFQIFVRAPSGTRIERTEQLIKDVEREIQNVIGVTDPGGQHADSDLQLLVSNIGVLMDWPAAYTPNTGPMDAFMLVQLKEQRRYSAQEYAAMLRRRLGQRFPGVEFAFDTGGMLTAALNFGLPSPINIQVFGSQLDVAHEIAQAIVEEVRGVRGATDVRIAQRLDYPAIEVNVDRVKAAYLGLTAEDVVKNIVTALNSSINFDPAFWIDHRNGNHYFIGAQYFEDAIQSLHTIENIPITGKNGTAKPVLLKNVATFERTSVPAVIEHTNITRRTDVFCNVVGRDVGSVAADIEHRLANSTTLQELMEDQGYAQRGYRYHMRGEVQRMQDSFQQFRFGLIIAALLVYLVMVAQLRSFLDPFIIMFAVPLGFIGVVWTLFLTGTHLNMPAFMGIIMMVGIVVEYSIILVDFITRLHREEGLTLHEAVVRAGGLRLRPILMTSLTTVLALLPMAIGFGHGGEANIPLARAIIGGVLGAMLLTLFVVPALYLMLKRESGPVSTVSQGAS